MTSTQQRNTSASPRRRSRPKRASGRRRRFTSRRGAASILSMMFLILFGSLVAAMSVASSGNIRTAASHLYVMQAMSAAETGLEIAEDRLEEAASRFIISESDMTDELTWAIWTGSASDIGTHEVISPAPSGYSEAAAPSGMVHALFNHHSADSSVLDIGGYITTPVIGDAPGDADTAVYRTESWLFTPPVAVRAAVGNVPPPAYQIRYAPLADGEHIRVIVDGFVFNQGRAGNPIRRTLVRDFRLSKRVEHAIISPTRIMIGKNVTVNGSIGAQYDDLDFQFGDPLVMRSDFKGLTPTLDTILSDFYDALNSADRDADNDNRLRFGHPNDNPEGLGNDTDYNDDDEPDNAFRDANKDGFLDEFDLFLNHFDTNNDGRVRLSDALASGTPASIDGSSAEFVAADGSAIDDELGYLIDSLSPDRNSNGVSGFTDIDGNGMFDGSIDVLADFDAATSTFPDQVLGYRDGYIDLLDDYTKLRGDLTFLVSASDWESEQGPISERISGPITPDEGDSALNFEAGDIPSITPDTFNATESALFAAADGDPFWEQVAAQLGLGTDTTRLFDNTWTVDDNPAGADQPWAQLLWSRDNRSGRPLNYQNAFWEPSPIGTGVWPDFYYRPVFKNFVFRDVQIPMGLNALFTDCTFVGVTYVRSDDTHSHPNFSEYGRMRLSVDDGYPEWTRPRKLYDGTTSDDYSDESLRAPAALDDVYTPPNADVWAADDARLAFLDLGDVLLGMEGSFAAGELDRLPNPFLVDVDGTRMRVIDSRDISNNIRFHGCLFVGSIVSDMPLVYTNSRNKLQFTGATKFVREHPTEPDNGFLNPESEDQKVIASSSMMLPNFSVEVGMINNPPEQRLDLNGLVVAGVLDMRGRASLNGALMLTFDPTVGEGPMVDLDGNPTGNPAGYNATIGFFEYNEGDYESFNLGDLPLDGTGNPIIGWDLDGDGLADLDYNSPPTPQQVTDGAVAVPFYGFGRIELTYDPDMAIPQGIMLPVRVRPNAGSYMEGQW